ncbi:MAG: globin [Acidimicrobiales bacterium]
MVGGEAWFVDLVDDFYDAVAGDATLLPLYPDDLTESRSLLAGFLVQYWGGPTTYSDERGHPRLRMRHQPFAIGVAERNAWFTHMAAAVRARELAPSVEAAVLDYFDRAATAMINRPD